MTILNNTVTLKKYKPLDTLIIPDVHEKIDLADHIVNQFPQVQKRIWLGDYLDSFEYENQPEHWTKVCEWMDRISQDPKNILLIGNHDVHYFCNIPQYRRSGYFGTKHDIVKKVLGQLKENAEKPKLVIIQPLMD